MMKTTTETTARLSEDVAQRGNRKWLIGVGIAALATAGAFALIGGAGSSAAESTADSAPVNTAEVIMADLTQEVSLAGTLGTVAGDPILAIREGVVTSAAEAGSIVNEAEALYHINNEPVVLLFGETPAYRDLALGMDTASVSAASAGVVTGIAVNGSLIEQGDIVYWIDGQPVIALYGETPMYRTLEHLYPDLTGADVAQLESALSDLGFTLGGTLTIDDQFTYGTQLAVQAWQESLGLEVDGILEPSDVVFIPGASQIVELDISVGDIVSAGMAVATLSTGSPMSGDDVHQLELSLVAQGFDAEGEMIADGVFSVETREAIIDWQRDVGQEPDGVINLGEVVFLPGSVRVTEQLTSPGVDIKSGAAVLATSSADQVVRVEIPAADQGLFVIGEVVTIVLPGSEEIQGMAVSIASTATVTQEDETFFEGIVELEDPGAASGLNEAPVSVGVMGASAEGVTVVPVTALVALAEGGYAVQIQTATGTQLVAVEPGFFANGLVAVQSEGLSVGDMVTLP